MNCKDRDRTRPVALPRIPGVPTCLSSVFLNFIAATAQRIVYMTMKFLALSAAIVAGSASAFAPATVSPRATTTTALNADKSQALPFMNKPALVSSEMLRRSVGGACLHESSWFENSTASTPPQN